ncbi:hypothetical protein FS837_009582 [Tulasnella sp. UAMH 9824]|nr:hypothetical protein FS837_009582 [Tulasnella sp. UAMH 9824]
MTRENLQQSFRSFLVKLNSTEAQMLGNDDDQEELRFSVVLEMKEENVPTATPNEQDPVPWVPAVLQHTAAGTSGEADVYMVRAVETGIINFSLAIQESEEKIQRSKFRASKGKESLAQS